MFTKRAKRVMLIGSILGILICAFGCVNLITSSSGYNEKYPYEKLPVRTLSIKIEESQRKELFAQLRKFSEKNHLSFNLSFVEGSQGEEIFFVEMHREGFEISALSGPTPYTTELDVNFYEEDPTNPPSQEKVNELYDDLKAFISEIPGVVIVEE